MSLAVSQLKMYLKKLTTMLNNIMYRQGRISRFLKRILLENRIVNAMESHGPIATREISHVIGLN